ncbi:MAG: arylsulfatase, partial [Bryobacteraceae bacterium]
MDRRNFIGSSLAGLAGFSGLAAQNRRQPNIVFIMLDDLGSADVGCYGQKKIQTPNIDRLAREGMRFTDCYAGGAVCAPSRCVLMTGLHTGHAAVRANAGTVPLRGEDVTAAEVLKGAGYATGGFGKWGLGDAGTSGEPAKQGFDQFFGYLHQIHAHSYYPEFLWQDGRKYPLQGNREGAREQYSADLIAERALQFVRDHKDGPFFLYAAFTLPHGRFEVPSDAPYSGKHWPQGEKNYAAMVTRADRQIGAILELLEELKLRDETIVFFTSDNGGTSGGGHDVSFFNSNGRLRGQKGQLYEGGIRVPMIVRWPGKVKAGAVNETPWAFCDFLPTAAELAGAQTPRGIDGISVLPELQAKGSLPSGRVLYWEHH